LWHNRRPRRLTRRAVGIVDIAALDHRTAHPTTQRSKRPGPACAGGGVDSPCGTKRVLPGLGVHRRGRRAAEPRLPHPPVPAPARRSPPGCPTIRRNLDQAEDGAGVELADLSSGAGFRQVPKLRLHPPQAPSETTGPRHVYRRRSAVSIVRQLGDSGLKKIGFTPIADSHPSSRQSLV
jgi:hypothetical protein